VVCLVASGAKIDRITTTTAKKDDATSSSSSAAETPTKVEYTTTLKDGSKQVLNTEYKQKFIKTYSTASVPPKGSIGLGTIKGKVGQVKPEKFMTITK
jgi:TorA maturation chaperone TorD